MRVYVSEFLVGGASAEAAAPASMRREGLAMLQAVTADIARMPNWKSVTTLEAGLSSDMAGEVIRINDAVQEAAVFEALLTQVNAVLVIAPETRGVLAERCRQVNTAAVASWNCSAESIELCGDKLRLAEHLQSNDLPTIFTTLVDFARIPDDGNWPQVLKPRNGAGSNLTFLVNNRPEWKYAARLFRQAGVENECINQPFVRGRNLSIGVNISLDGRGIECLQVGEQKLSTDGRFRYLGGRIPAAISSSTRDAIEQMALKTCRTISGLAGYIGIDLLLPDREDPVIVEINPRLTSSYIGYRQFYSTPLPRQWLSGNCAVLSRRNTDSIEWNV